MEVVAFDSTNQTLELKFDFWFKPMYKEVKDTIIHIKSEKVEAKVIQLRGAAYCG